MKLFAPLIIAWLLLAEPASAALRFFGTTTIPAGDTVANSSAATVLSTKLIMPPTDVINDPTAVDIRYGQTFTVDSYCTIGTAASPGTLTIDVVHATGASGTTYTTLGTTGAVTPPASLTANTNEAHLHGFAVYNTTGTAGVATFFGDLTIEGASNAVTEYPMLPSTMGSGGVSGWATGLATNSAIINAVAIRVTWSSASTSNTITCATFIQRVA